MAAAAPSAPPLSRAEGALVVGIYAAILAATVFAFAAAFAWLPHQAPGTATGSTLIFSGLAITAYVLGLRHGFDADHIAAIDNTTRKLLHDGKRPLTVGTWFSLGHSTIVAGMIGGLVVATQYLAAHYRTLESVGSVVGTVVSGVFLFVIGLVNLVIVAEVYRLFRGLRDRELDARQLDDQMDKRGFLYRYFGRLFRVVRAPWQVYPIGVLFGLGFDTATEVLLITFAVGLGLAVPIWTVLLLPLLFTCGMVLSDTTDGIAMRYAYGWAFLKPIRKVYYNLTLTVLSVLVAFVVGGIELLQVLSGELGLGGPFWGWLDRLDFVDVGFGIAVTFVVAWIVAMGIYRIKRYEEIGFGPAAAPAEPAR